MQSERGADRAKSGRQLATRFAVCAEAGTGWLRILSKADRRVRSPTRTVSPGTREAEPNYIFAGRKAQGTTQKEEGNAPQFDLREGLFRISGTDLTQIDSIDVMTANHP